MQQLLPGIFCLWLALIPQVFAQEQHPRGGRIVGGREASISDYPWQVSLTDSSGAIFICGGSIIAERWVITAAHCLGQSNMAIRAGVSLRNDSSGQNIPVQSQISHPQYNAARYDYDIALLYLSAPLDLSGPRARAIPLMNAALAAAGLEDPGVISAISGWGYTT